MTELSIAYLTSEHLTQDEKVEIFKKRFTEVLEAMKNEIDLAEIEWNVGYMKKVLETARNDNITLSIKDTVELAQGVPGAVQMLATLRTNDEFLLKFQWDWAMKGLKENLGWNLNNLPNSNTLLEDLAAETVKVGGTLIEESAFKGRKIQTTLKILVGTVTVAHSIFETKEGKTLKGLTSMKKGKQKYLACLRLVAQLKQQNWPKESDFELS